jgi:hypothetical protein
MKSEVKGLTSLPFWNQEYGNISSNLGAKISSNSATSLASILGNQNFFRPSFSSDRTAAQSEEQDLYYHLPLKTVRHQHS